MHGFFIEKRTPSTGLSLSRDLAQHIFVRSTKGYAIVVTDRPQDLASITKKQWNILIDQVQRERASTLNFARITALNNQLAWMQQLKFVVQSKKGRPDSGIIFATPEEAVQNPGECSTIYLMQEVDQKQFKLITNSLTEDGVLIEYCATKR